MTASLVLSLLLLIGGGAAGAAERVQENDSQQVNQAVEQPAETATAFKGDPCWTW